MFQINKDDIEFDLINKPNWVDSCIITVFANGKVLLNWNGRINGLPTGEDGFFISIRAAKMYVTKRITKEKSKWEIIFDDKY